MCASSYTEAVAAGSDRYFTGAPCKHGHVCERLTRNRTCTECSLISVRASTRRHYANNADTIREKARVAEARKRKNGTAWQCRNKTLHAAMKAEWKKENPGAVQAAYMARKTAKMKATPQRLSADEVADMRWTYDLAAQCTIATGVRHEVDHEVPLQGKTVCGLHVPWNLRVLTADENNRRPRIWAPE